MKNKIWLCIWIAAGLYFIVSALGAGGGMTATMAMFCGFMAARNVADVIAA